MNRLGNADRTLVISCLVEGNSQRATTRMTGAWACRKFQAEFMRSQVHFQSSPLP